MINELFLWSVNDRHYLLTPDKKTEVTLTADIDNGDKSEGYPASQLLPEELLKYLENHLDLPDTITRLYLHKSLSSTWQHLDWEKLSLCGKILSGRLQLVRYTNFEIAASLSKQQKWLMFDHWEDTRFFSAALQSETIEIKFKTKIDSCLKHNDINNYQGLLIIAHGSEQTEQNPLLTADKHPWQLQLPQRLPAIVLIIACASNNNNFELLIKECLAKGAETIIAPHGQLDAKLMQDFLTGYFTAPSHSIADYLYSQQQENPQANGGANCLRLYGKLQPLSPSVLKDYRQTNLNYHFHKHNILNNLRQAHSIGHETDAQQWLETTLNFLPALPVATQVLLIDYCDYLAEQWATDKIQDIAKIRGQLNKNNSHYATYENEFKSYVQAKTYRREGKYEKSCLSCAALYKRLIEQKDNALLADFYGLLLNILIDLNLPKSANKVSQLLQRCIRNDESDLETDRKNKQYDRQARLYMRQTKYKRAIQNYLIKFDTVGDLPSRREITTLLYAQAWTCPGNDEIENSIITLMDVISGSKSKTFNELKYEIRALALAAWQTENKDSSLSALLKHYAPDIIQDLGQSKDKGPAGMAFFFAYLAGIEDYQHKDDFEKAIVALNDDSYFLELALLLSLCNQTEIAQQYLKNYHIMREDSLDKLNQFWQANGIEIHCERSDREAQESQLIEKFDRQYMLDNGLIPL
jgi:hypothetical protein